MSIADLKQRLASLDVRQRQQVLVAVALVLAVAILYSFCHDRLERLVKRRLAREATLAEMLSLRQRYRDAQSGAQRLANRLAAVKADDTPAKLIEEIGIKGKGLQVRSLPASEGADLAEVRIDGVTANEAVNLLYRLEQGVRPVVIRKSLLKTRFDDPARLDLTLTIALQKQPAATP
jgi:general secretion pathway protein M